MNANLIPGLLASLVLATAIHFSASASVDGSSAMSPPKSPSLARCPAVPKDLPPSCASETYISDCKDDSGCPGRKCCPNKCQVLTCTKPECPLLKCGPCDFDYVYDDMGCRTCQCLPNPCSVKLCPSDKVCKVTKVQCFAAPCPPIGECVDQCPLVKCTACDYDYVYDSNGCQTCECLPDPCLDVTCPENNVCQVQEVECVAAPCPPQAQCVYDCSPVRCSTQCPDGFDKDENGCQTCTCSPPPTPVVDPGPIVDPGPWGKCPPVITIGCVNKTMPVDCKSDSECNPGQICCPTFCNGAKCQDPYQQPPMPREGICPFVDKRTIRCSDPAKDKRFCNDDSSCDGTQKCCSNGCSFDCTDAEPYRKGECPMRSNVDCDSTLTCATNGDSECPGEQRCCWSNCGDMRCMDPANPGYCPAPPEGMMGTCVIDENSCVNDFACGDSSKKCCPVGCNTNCVPSVQPVWKDGNCPNFNWNQKCDTEPGQCDNDVECGGTKKCCSSPCGPTTQCIEPAVIRAGDCPPINPMADCYYKQDPFATPETPGCFNDDDCDGAQKCCPVACKASQCQAPVTPIVKPGECPKCDPITGANCYYGIGKPVPGAPVASPPNAGAGSAGGASAGPRPPPVAAASSDSGAPVASGGGTAGFPSRGGMSYCSSDAACWDSAKCCEQPWGGYACSEIDICALPYETGTCKALFERWYFDKTAGKCLTFNYGGCDGNANNFEQESDCQARCMPTNPSVRECRPLGPRTQLCAQNPPPSACTPEAGCQPDQLCCPTQCAGYQCTTDYIDINDKALAGEKPSDGAPEDAAAGGAGGSPPIRPGEPQPGAGDNSQPQPGAGDNSQPPAGGNRDGVCPADRVGRKYHTDVSCTQDGDCPGKKKCCSRAGDRVCRSPDVPKKGTCPGVTQVKFGKPVSSKCDADSECCDNQKCCEKENGSFECADPVAEPQIDPRCPDPKPDGMMGICAIMCQIGSPCNDGKMCCKTACDGTSCMDPPAN